MKRLLLTIGLIAGISAGLYAQKSNVRRAENLTLQEKPDFNGARSAIKEAVENETTKNDPKTYFVAGMIGFTENEEMVKNMMLGQENKVDRMKKGEAIVESYNYFMKANELDQTPNKKGKVKPKFSKRIRENVKEYYTAQHNLISYGADLFEKRDYEKAADVFSIYLEIPNLSIMRNDLSTNDSTYHMIKYFRALAYTNSDQHAKAIEAYESLKGDNYEVKNVHQLLAEEYKKTDQIDLFISTLEDGFKIFPEDPWFLQNIINHYIFNSQIEEAASYLDAAILQAPDVAEYHYVKGNIEERLGKKDVAIAAFSKAIELEPKMAVAHAGIGRVIFNKAVEILQEADNIRDNRAYNEEVEKANVIFRESMPYLEKAVELDSTDNDFKQTLKMLYYRLGEDDKYNAISKELGE